MIKRIIYCISISLIVVGVSFVLATSQSAIIKVAAQAQNLVISVDQIAFGNVFPEEVLEKHFTVSLSQSFIDQGPSGDVVYQISQATTSGLFDLRPFIVKEKDPLESGEGDTEATSTLSLADLSDKWLVNFEVPDVFTAGDYGMDIIIKVLSAPVIHPFVWVVDDDYPNGGCPDPPHFASIQGAIGDSQVLDNDIILVCPGTYNESIIVDKSLKIRSSDGAGATFVDGTGLVGKNGFKVVNVNDVEISGFTIQNFLGSGIGILLNNASGALIQSNHLTGNKVGIKLTKTNNTDIGHNTFLDNSSHGLIVWETGGNSSNNNYLHHNTFRRHGWASIIVWSSGAPGNSGWRIEHNNLRESGLLGGHGLRVTNGNNFRIRRNRIDESGAAGLFIASENGFSQTQGHIIYRNEVTDSAWSGIVLAARTGTNALFNNELDRNSLRDNNRDGIELKVEDSGSITNTLVEDNQIYNNNRHGIFVYKNNPSMGDISSNTFYRNRIRKSGENGLYVLRSNLNIIRRNQSQRNGQSGIKIDDSDYNLVKSNRLSRNNEYGIGLINASSYNQIIRNNARRNELYDLFWDSTGLGNDSENNRFRTSTPAGWWD